MSRAPARVAEGKIANVRAQLSPNEETTLRRIAGGAANLEELRAGRRQAPDRARPGSKNRWQASRVQSWRRPPWPKNVHDATGTARPAPAFEGSATTLLRCGQCREEK